MPAAIFSLVTAPASILFAVIAFAAMSPFSITEAVMAGYGAPEHTEEAATYETAAKDYAGVLVNAPKHTFSQGKCIY